MWHDGWGSGASGFWVMVLVMGLFWGALIATAIWAIRQFRPRDADTDRGSTAGAMRILEERFARGEIDREEFEQRRATLRGG